MSYSVYIQKFKNGKADFANFTDVAAILNTYGLLNRVGDRIAFIPSSDDLCEVGFVSGTENVGIDAIGFQRPISGGRLILLIFDLLAIPGMCYFELECTYVLARSDLTADLPEGLRLQCESGSVTVISSMSEVPL